MSRSPSWQDLNLFMGSSSLIPVEACPGVTAPVLPVDYLCSFDQNKLSAWFKTPSKQPTPTLNELFKKLVQSADNFGDTDEWRALNYLAVFAFYNTTTGVVQKYFVRVDVSNLFPIIINDIDEYFDC